MRLITSVSPKASSATTPCLDSLLSSFNVSSRVERCMSCHVFNVLAVAELDAKFDLERVANDLVDSIEPDGSDLIDKEMSGLEDI